MGTQTLQEPPPVALSVTRSDSLLSRRVGRDGSERPAGHDVLAPMSERFADASQTGVSPSQPSTMWANLPKTFAYHPWTREEQM
jgi:hypothetical protein